MHRCRRRGFGLLFENAGGEDAGADPEAVEKSPARECRFALFAWFVFFAGAHRDAFLQAEYTRSGGQRMGRRRRSGQKKGPMTNHRATREEEYYEPKLRLMMTAAAVASAATA